MRAPPLFAALRTRNVIAYLVDEISTSPHPVVSLDGARDAGWESGFLVAAHVTRSNPELEALTIEAIHRDPERHRRHLFDDFHPPGFAAAAIWRRADGSAELPQPRTDASHAIVPGEVAGAFTATQHLIAKGHSRIGFINGEPWMEASADRLKGYRQALATADIAFDPSIVRNGDWLPLQGCQPRAGSASPRRRGRPRFFAPTI